MPAPARKPGPASVITRILLVQYVLQHLGAVRPGSGRVHEHTTLGSRPAPGTPSAKRSVGTRRAASMQDTLSEGTARTRSARSWLAPSAVTASAVGGSATRSVVADSLRRRAARVEEHARSRGVESFSLAQWNPPEGPQPLRRCLFGGETLQL